MSDALLDFFMSGKQLHRISLSEKKVASLIAQLVKNLPTIQETPVGFLGQEDPLEKG